MVFYRLIMMMLVSFVLSVSGLRGVNQLQLPQKFFSPPRKPIVPIIKPSPGTDLIYLTNFHRQMIAALDCEDFNVFGGLLRNYFSLIPYNLVIKDERFFLSLFYLIFKLISGVDPVFDDFNKTLMSLVKAKTGSVYALEFSFADCTRKKAYALFGSVGQEIPVIRIICDVENPSEFIMRGEKITKAQHRIFFEEEEASVLLYNQNNFARNILSILAEEVFDKHEFHKNLSELYNTIPDIFHIEREKYFQALFVLMLTFVRAGAGLHEIVSSIGRSDVMVSSEDVINVIEFKHKGSVAKALQQIKDRRYCSIYHQQKKSIRMVGINVKCEVADGAVSVAVAAEPYNTPPQSVFAWVSDEVDGARNSTVKKLF